MREKSFARCCGEKWMYFEGWHTRFLLSQLLRFFNLTHTHTGSEAEPLPESWWFPRWEQIFVGSASHHITGPLPESSAYVCSVRISSSRSLLIALARFSSCADSHAFFSLPLLLTLVLFFFSIFKSSSTHDSHCLLIIPLYFCKWFFALCGVWNIITLYLLKWDFYIKYTIKLPYLNRIHYFYRGCHSNFW